MVLYLIWITIIMKIRFLINYQKNDTMHMIDNNGNIDGTTDRICEIMQSKIEVKKRSFYG